MSTATPPTPSRPAPRPPAPKTAPPAASRSTAPSPAGKTSIRRGISAAAHKITIYGPGGVGKSEACSLLSQVGVEPLFLDIEGGCHFLDVARVDPAPTTWEQLLSVLRDRDSIAPFGAIVIDSATKAEELAIAWTLENVPHEKGHRVTSIEAYGFGKGYTHVFETYLQLLGELDAVARSGKHVVLIAHDCTANVPNPNGEDWIRYEPRLQSPPSGKGSIRHRVKEWCDHLLYVGFDLVVDKEGKATGGGTRTIYPAEMPTHWAKSRKIADPVPYDKGDAAIWRQLFA
jgi:hypothetical protein